MAPRREGQTWGVGYSKGIWEYKPKPLTECGSLMDVEQFLSKNTQEKEDKRKKDTTHSYFASILRKFEASISRFKTLGINFNFEFYQTFSFS